MRLRNAGSEYDQIVALRTARALSQEKKQKTNDEIKDNDNESRESEHVVIRAQRFEIAHALDIDEARADHHLVDDTVGDERHER